MATRATATYNCRICQASFFRGTAYANHMRVHAAPPRAGAVRTRFLGSEPYDADDYAPHALLEDETDGGAPRRRAPPLFEPAAPAPRAPADFTVEEELNLRLCELKTNGNAGRGLSEADMNNILRIVALSTTVSNPHELFTSCDELSQKLLSFVSARPELAWYVGEVRAPSFPHVPPVKFVYRRLEDVLKTLVKVLPLWWGFWGHETTTSGERIYAHPCGALFFEAVCELLSGTGIWALALQLWSDKAHLTKRGNKSFYPMNCVLLNVIFDLYREQWPNSTIAFLPIIDAADVPNGMTEREFKLYKAEIEAACLEKVLFPVLDKDHVFNVVDITGASRNVVAVLHSWVADFMEQVTLAGLIGLTGCSRCHVHGKKLLPSLGRDSLAAPRTAKATSDAVAQMRTAWAEGKLTSFDELRTTTRLQGVAPILLSLYQRGFLGSVAMTGSPLSNMVPASVMPLDTMHVFEEGWTKRLIIAFAHHFDRTYGKATGKWLTDTLALRFETSLNMAFIEETKWPNPWRVFRGKGKKADEGCGGLQACEMRAICQLLPTLLVGILGAKQADGSWRACDPDADYLTDTFCAYVHYLMELKRYNRPPGHTERTLQQLRHLKTRFIGLVRQHFLDDQTSGFAFPKAHQGFSDHVPASIRELGELKWLTTEWGENSVKTGHAAYEATNKHTATAEEQMAAHLAKRQATRAAFDDAGLSVVPAGLGTQRTARREVERTGTNTLALASLFRVAVADFDATPLPPPLLGRPGMAAFRAELHRRLLEDGKAMVEHIYIVNSAVLSARMDHHPDEYAGTTTHTVYASPSFRDRQRFSFVALEGSNASDDRPEEWIAQVLLLFRLPDGAQLAYVQFLVADTTRAGIGPLFGSPGCAPLVWERVEPRSAYSYAVTPLDKLIRREFVVPDLSTVYAPRGRRQEAREAAKARKLNAAKNFDDSSSDSSTDTSSGGEASDTGSEFAGQGEHDVALELAEDGPTKRWPRWIRIPFVWGWVGV